MSAAAAVDALLVLGAEDAHPASAVVGIRTAAGLDVAVGGWAELPSAGGAGGVPAGVPMRRELLIDLASVTKAAVTTVLAMRLVADGRLDLAAPVRGILPGFTADEAGAVTVEHLLTHTAGLRPWWPFYLETRDRDEALGLTQRMPLVTAPGAAMRYSDLSFMLAGLVVERVAGLAIDAAFRELVAEPLGLSARYGPVPAADAAVSADSDAWERRMVATGEPYPVPFAAADFDGWRDRPLRGEVNDGNAAHALAGVSGHAGLFGSIDDLVAVGAALSPGEGRREDLVPDAIVERFARPSAVAPDQAVGFRLRELPPAGVGDAPRRLLWHGGFTGTHLAFSPDAPLVVAGAAMRLHGTVGPLPADGTGDDAGVRVEPVPGTAVNDVLHDLARRIADGTTTPGEDR